MSVIKADAAEIALRACWNRVVFVLYHRYNVSRMPETASELLA